MSNNNDENPNPFSPNQFQFHGEGEGGTSPRSTGFMPESEEREEDQGSVQPSPALSDVTNDGLSEASVSPDQASEASASPEQPKKVSSVGSLLCLA